MKFEKLFKPIKIGPVEIKNRIVMAPMNTHMANSDGSVSEQELCYYAARAKGGTGLIITGAFIVSQRAWEQYGSIMEQLVNPRHASGASVLAETIHHFGAKVFIQLTTGFGRQLSGWQTPLYSASGGIPIDRKLTTESTPDFHRPFLSVGPTLKPLYSNVPREMTAAEIKQDIADYVRGADLAIVAGFDGIEIHAPHGYLLHQFLSPRTNKRTDEYGGSLENRARFLLEILKAIRTQFGPNLPICVRMSSADHVEGGITPEDMRKVAKLCEKAGANIIHLSDGSWEANVEYCPNKENTHILEEQGKKLKAAIKIPIISFSIHDPELAEKAIAEGQTDMISMGRQLLADPDWANKVREGRVKEIVRCQREYACMTSLYRKRELRCIMNPNLGRERYMPEYWPQKRTVRIPETLARVRGIKQTHVVSPTTGRKLKMLE